MGKTKLLLFTNTLSQIIGKVFSAGSTAIVGILIARSLGVNGFGDFAKVTTFIGFFYLFVDFGLNPIYLEDALKKKNTHAFQSLIATRLFLSTLFIFALCSLVWFLPGSETQGYNTMVKIGIILYSPTILFQSMYISANAVFQKNFEYSKSALALAIGSLVSVGAVVFLLSRPSPANSISILLGITLGYGCTAITAYILSKRGNESYRFHYDTSDIKQNLFRALPLSMTLATSVIYSHADAIILTITRSTAEVGIYALAYKLFEFLLVIPTFFMNSLYPLLVVNQKNQQLHVYQRRIKKSFALLIGISLVVVICAWFLAPIVTVIRAEFFASIAAFRILLFGLPIFFLSSITMWMLVVEKKQKELLSIYLSAMVINIALNIIFVPLHGYIASAWITVFSELYVLGISLLTLKKSFRDLDKNL